MKDYDHKSKIVVVGAGNVGATIAYTLVMSDSASEIVLVDVNKEKAKGEALDINHGIAYLRQITVKEGGYEECADADLILITAGTARKPGQTRLELTKINVAIARDIIQNIMKHNSNPLLLVISNPVDIITYIIQKETGLPAHRVIGSGTTLDTSRFRYLISRHCQVDVRNVHAYIIGEHGDSEVPVWSRANVAGKPFEEFCADCSKNCKDVNRNAIFEQAKDAGAEIIKLKGATYYGIALAVLRVVTAIMNDEHSILTVSSVLNGEYDIYDVALSLPCVVSANGIENIYNIRISDKEIEQVRQSAVKLKEVIKEVY